MFVSSVAEVNILNVLYVLYDMIYELPMGGISGHYCLFIGQMA